jgi:hypothetical protein
VIVAALRVRGLARGGRSGLDRKTPATEARPLS